MIKLTFEARDSDHMGLLIPLSHMASTLHYRRALWAPSLLNEIASHNIILTGIRYLNARIIQIVITLGSLQNELIFRLLLKITVERITFK